MNAVQWLNYFTGAVIYSGFACCLAIGVLALYRTFGKERSSKSNLEDVHHESQLGQDEIDNSAMYSIDNGSFCSIDLASTTSSVK